MPVIQCSGLKVHYTAPEGLPISSSDQLVLLVHGAGGSSRHWEPMLKAWSTMPLTERVFPVAVDLPGHGNSGGTVLSSVLGIADFLNAFLSALGIKGSICYVGHSAGGLLGLQFALSYPERVDRLMLIATFACIQLHPDFLQQATTGAWDYTLLQQSFAPDVPEDLKQLVLNEFQYLRLAADARDFMDLNHTDLRPALPALQLPTLIMTGDDDVIISPRKAKLLQQELPEAELVTVPGAGHYVHVEQGATVAALLVDFLQQSQLPVCPV
jgi:pimeloyl-ACP methyl ester carboxylesterase